MRWGSQLAALDADCAESTNGETWEERFDREFVARKSEETYFRVSDIKAFIAREIAIAGEPWKRKMRNPILADIQRDTRAEVLDEVRQEFLRNQTRGNGISIDGILDILQDLRKKA